MCLWEVMVWVLKTGHHACFIWAFSRRARSWLSYIITYPWVVGSEGVLRLTVFLAPCRAWSVIITHRRCCECGALVWQSSRGRLHRRVLALLISYSLLLVMSFVMTSLLLLETAVTNATSTPLNICPQLGFPGTSTSCCTLWWAPSKAFLLG